MLQTATCRRERSLCFRQQGVEEKEAKKSMLQTARCRRERSQEVYAPDSKVWTGLLVRGLWTFHLLAC